MITLHGRTVNKTMETAVSLTILELALKNKVDWGFSCKRGTCSRCRCLVLDGMEHLTAPTEKEQEGLEQEELEEGYRLGCQAKIKSQGTITVTFKPYY